MTQPTRLEVKPCPFCGSANISEGEVLTSNPDGGVSTQSRRRDCGALGPDAHLRAGELDFGDVKATIAWNRRAPVEVQAEAVRAAVDYDDVVSICEAPGIGLPVDCVEKVVEIIRLVSSRTECTRLNQCTCALDSRRT
jgi:hypothetical protein